MLRRFRACLSVLALLYGLTAAPYTHAHQAIDAESDEHHLEGQTLVHTHATPHPHHHDAEELGAAIAGNHAGTERVWSVDSFLFQQPPVNPAPGPALLAFGEPPVALTSVWLGAHRPQPRAHGPPLALSSPLRAPPAFPPLFA
jgi:hypothetical protein